MHRPLLFLALMLVSAAPVSAAEPAIAFGTRHAVALRSNGEVITWGDNVMCQLGRAAGNANGTPRLVLRNGVAVAAGSEHSLAVTSDGKVYGWGSNPEGALGMGNTFDQCEGPVEVPSLVGKDIVQIGTGHGFSVALTRSGELLCSGDNSMSQCPGATGGRSEVFIPVSLPALSGGVVAIKTGAFHTLALTRDGRLFAFGRGRDGQLGQGRAANGAGFVTDLTGVVSFSAGTWHSAAVRTDGSVWTWGSNLRSQLCDGTTTNRSTPAQVVMPAGRVSQVVAGGHSTIMRAVDGTLFGCGDNQNGLLGTGPEPTVGRPQVLTGLTSASGAIAVGGANAAVSPDGCGVRMSGDGSSGLLVSSSRTFVARAGLSLCGPAPAAPLANLLREPIRGGLSNCWTPRIDEDAAASPRFAPLRQAMLSAELLFKSNAAFGAPLEPVRLRTSMSAGPDVDGGARMHVKVVPERKTDGTRLWTGTCDVIPQLDRIGGAISQVSIFFNEAARAAFISPSGTPPKLTGRVGGFPEYNGWILIAPDGRVPWVPVTLAERLDAEAERRQRALADWNRSRSAINVPDEAALLKTYEMLKRTDPAGAEKFLATGRATAAEVKRQQTDVHPLLTASLERQIKDLETYRGTFTPEQLRAAAVSGDPTGEGRRRLDAELATIRASLPVEQRQPRMAEAIAAHDLRNLRPGSADQALHVKPNPAFPDPKAGVRVQLIAVLFSLDPNARNVERRAWQQQVKETFDLTALAALLK